MQAQLLSLMRTLPNGHCFCVKHPNEYGRSSALDVFVAAAKAGASHRQSAVESDSDEPGATDAALQLA